ncbi:MAG: MerR family transcriptional regulator [Solirubrobacterales bacterium]
MASPLATDTVAGAGSPGSLTINEAAETTGWSARMLRYIESVGLVEPPRSAGGYRLYGPAELQRLRTLRELLREHGLEIGDVGFARRLRDTPRLDHAISEWLEQTPERPADVAASDWLGWEQQKHHRLLLGDSTFFQARADEVELPGSGVPGPETPDPLPPIETPQGDPSR